MGVITDEKKIDELLTRGVDRIYPSKEDLKKVLLSGKRLRLYQGFDPTGDKLHIGHMVGLRKLAQWQELGHGVIFLIGDFTAMVGDPSGKLSARKFLTHEETLTNAKTYKKQASKILRFDGDNPAEVLFNGNWLGKLSAIDFLRIASHLTYGQIIERDMFQERIKQGQDVYANEFLYPVMQAYDSVAMDVNLEIGGKDQMFNMLMGRKLMRHMLKKEKFVMTTNLLEDDHGVKIGKTEGNAIALDDKPEELYGKIMAFPDEVIVKCFECLTTIPMEEVLEIQNTVLGGKNSMLLKKKLAFTVVSELSNEEKAKQAEENFSSIFQKGETPENVPEIEAGRPIDVVVLSGAADSASAARRLFEAGAVFDLTDGRKVSAKDELARGHTYRAGKRHFFRVK